MIMISFYSQLSQSWLRTLALVGILCMIVSFFIGLVGSGNFPILGLLAIILHVLGLLLIIASGMIYSILWWRDYIYEKIG